MEMFAGLLFVLLSPAIFYLGLLSLVFFPLTLVYFVWERRLMRVARATDAAPRVSVVVPAYNEERTIALSITSILDTHYPDFEVIVVNDGSSDGTEAELQAFLDSGRIRYICKSNGGKASALNVGIAQATGDLVFFTDADTVFTPTTIADAARYFVDPNIGALGGNDTPLRPRGALQKMLVVTSHIGTGYVRRALSVLGVLPIIPGNLGVVRTALLREIGGFRELWGEDLEITFRLHAHGVRIVYGAKTKVLAECPHSLRGLWKQRVRWVRSYIKVLRLHWTLVGNPTRGLFGPYLALLSASMILIPPVQLLLLALLPFAIASGSLSLAGLEWVAYLSLSSLLVVSLYAILIDRTPNDLFYLPYVLLLVPLSLFYNAVVLYSIWTELRRGDEAWNKLDRRDVASIPISAGVERREVALGSLALAGLSAGGIFVRSDIARGEAQRADAADTRLTVAIHFPDWPTWTDAVKALASTPELRHVDQVAISAGRPDWTYFRWKGRKQWWSKQQKQAPADMLEETVAVFRANGRRTSAVLDVFAPRYIEDNPDCAALDWRGKPSEEIVCSTCLAEEDFGDLLAEACGGLAAHTAAESICITELFYDVHCYDSRCRAAFHRATGRDSWPRRPDNNIDLFDPLLTAWRSKQVAGVVRRLADVVRPHGKQFMVDVKVSRSRYALNSRENGQDYALLLPLVDRLVVWDYFALEGLPPQSSKSVASYLSRTLGAERYWHSIGLWGRNHGTLGADEMARSIVAAVKGGAENVWITPGGRLGPEHWRAIASLKEGEAVTG